MWSGSASFLRALFLQETHSEWASVNNEKYSSLVSVEFIRQKIYESG